MSESLREQLEANFDKFATPPAEEAAVVVDAVEPSEPAPVEAAPAPVAEQKKDERPRDTTGKFLPKEAAAEQAKPPTPQKPSNGALTPPAAAPVQAARKPRPTSWKKDMETYWDQLPPEVQAYVGQRESEYATGVSTYKTEADRAKGVMTALAEFEPDLQRANMPVDKWIQSLGYAHKTLAQGAPQDKINLIQSILANNRIPAQLAVQGADGQWQLLGAPAPQQQPPQPQFNPSDIDARIQRVLAEEKATAAYAAFQQEVEAGKYPHLEEVKQTMGRLLESGFAKDYSSAYTTALALPEHAHLSQVAPQAPVQQEAARQTEQQKVQRARSQAVSVRSSTPSAMAPATGPKGLRDQLSEAYDSAVSSRV